MARVSMSYQFASGDALHVSVQAATNYPDALAEAKRICCDALHEAMDFGVTVDEDGDE